VVFRGAGAGAIAEPFDLASCLSSGHHTDGRVNVFLDGPLPFDLFTENYQDVTEVRRRILLDRVEHFLAQGATISINRIDRDLTHVRRICDCVQAFTGEVATANCYAALSGNGSFGRHWDTHDVLALQLVGEKRWQVWEPTYPLPTPGQTSRGRESGEVPEPSIDVILGPGDVLYVPRGWWHRTSVIEDCSTVHLAVGLHACTLADYLAWLSTKLLSRDIALRRSLTQIAKDEGTFHDYMETFVQHARDPLHLESYAQEHKKLATMRAPAMKQPFRATTNNPGALCESSPAMN
jgi:ribosomal protein L16 Arg81 hydroxylase